MFILAFKLVQNVTHVRISWSLPRHDIEFNKTKQYMF